MGTWSILATDQFWRYAMMAIPLTAMVAVMVKCLPCRPATRHALWLFVLVWLIVAPLLPAAPRIDVDPAYDKASTWLTEKLAAPEAQPEPDIDDAWPVTQPVRSIEGLSTAISRQDEPRATSRIAKEWSAARLRLDDGPSTPFTLAQATGSDGSPTVTLHSSRSHDRLSRRRYRSIDRDDLADASSTSRRIGITSFEFESVPLDLRVPEEPVSPSKPAVAAQVESTWMVGAREWAASLAVIRDTIGRLPAMPTGIWLAGTALIALLAVIRVMRFRSLLAVAAPAPGSVKRLVAREAASMNLRTVPQVLFVKRCISPMIWCGRRIRLILPVALWQELDETGRRAVVLHELAHVQRRDHWVSRVELLVGAIYWWYPLVWWVRGKMHAEAEECCDAWVTSLLPRNRRAYAEALLRTKQYVRTGNQTLPVLGIGITNGRAERFARRLKMVMTRSVRPGRSLPGTMLVMLMATSAWVVTPAQSCPKHDKANASVNAAPRVVAVPTVEALVGVAPIVVSVPDVVVVSNCAGCKSASKACSKCKAGKGWNSCKSCKKSKTGKCCGSCGSGKGISFIGVGCGDCKLGSACKSCSTVKGLRKKLRTTYDNYVAGKSNATGHYTDAIHYLVDAAGKSKFAKTYRVGYGDKDLQKRLERLERQLERLGDQLERGRDGRSSGKGKIKARKKERRQKGERRADRAPGAPRARRAPRAPRAFAAPHPAHAPQADFLFGPDSNAFFGLDDDGGKTTTRSYELPAGKLKALIALMSRDDIPVLIRPADGAIEVQGSARQHRIFKAFVNIIHPKKKSKGRRTGVQVLPGMVPMPSAPEIAELRALAELKGSRHAYDRALHAREADVHRQHAEQAAHAAQVHEYARQAVEMDHKAHEEHARQIEHEHDALRDQADNLLDAAEEMREQAEELREQAEELRGEIEDADKEGVRKDLMVKAESLLAGALDLENIATDRELEGNRVERQADEVQKQADLLQVQAEMQRIELEAQSMQNARQQDRE